MTESNRIDFEQPRIQEGFLYVGPVKVCRVESGVLYFLDKNRRTSSQRGSDQVPVRANEVLSLFGTVSGGFEALGMGDRHER